MRADFMGVIKNAMSGIGLAPDAAMVDFPVDMFLPAADLSPLTQRKREFYTGLTRWRTGFEQAASTGTMIKVAGANYAEAVDKANNLYLTNLWGDGLPVQPPTRERVDWILRGTVLPRDHVFGKLLPRGSVVTAESCAVALAMAGGRPEYLPVLLAAVEAFLDPHSDSEHLQADSASAFPVIIVNGPIAKEIRLNSTFGCLGPDPQRPAGASIGRALRLMQQNLGGALPGVGAMAIYGAMRLTNVVFAQNDEDLPAGWQPHNTERHGFAPGTNSVSLFFATGATNIRRRGVGKETPEQDALEGMHRMADYMRSPNLGSLAGYEKGTPGMLMIPPVVAQAMAKVGWTQQSMREFLWEHSKIPRPQLDRNGGTAWIRIHPNPLVRNSIELDPWPLSATPDNIILMVAGGGHPTNSYWLEGYSPGVVGRIIRTPETFDQLLKEAEDDLGCGAEACMI